MGRTLIYALTLAILATAIVVVLGILNVKPFEELWKDLITVLQILGVCTAAALLIFGLTSLAKGKGQGPGQA